MYRLVRWPVEMGWHLSLPGKGKCRWPWVEGGLWLSPLGWHTHTHTHPRCHLPQQKIKVLATTRRPHGERRVNRSMMQRTHAALGAAGVTNKQTCGQCQQGERCQRNSGSRGTLHCNKPHCPLLLLAAEHEQSAPPGHTARAHRRCLDGDASSTGVLGRNLQEGTLAHHAHVCHMQASCLKPHQRCSGHIFVQIRILFKKWYTYMICVCIKSCPWPPAWQRYRGSDSAEKHLITSRDWHRATGSGQWTRCHGRLWRSPRQETLHILVARGTESLYASTIKWVRKCLHPYENSTPTGKRTRKIMKHRHGHISHPVRQTCQCPQVWSWHLRIGFGTDG